MQRSNDVTAEVVFGGPSSTAHSMDLPAGPRSLPGDLLPPLAMLEPDGQLKTFADLPPELKRKLHEAHGDMSVPHSTVPAPPLDIAIEGALAALAASKAAGMRGGVAVVDSAGEARVMLTADGEDGSHVFVAHRKALTALEFKMNSADAMEMISKNRSLVGRVHPAMFVQFGAIPITSRGQIIGAIGYSGGDDVNGATAGWKVIQSRLPQ